MLTITPPLQRTPQRIISVVPNLTEVLCTFGLEQHIVGMTDYYTELESQAADEGPVSVGQRSPGRSDSAP
jgi:hypothetical protein